MLQNSFSRDRSAGAFVSTQATNFAVGTFDTRTYGPYSFDNSSGSVTRMSDMVTPGFNKLSNQGKLFNKPMTRSLEQRVPSNGTVVFTYVGRLDQSQTYTWVGDYLSAALGSQSPDIVWPDERSLIDEAVIKCMSNVNSASSMLLVTIAERAKTMDMIGKRARQLYSAYRAVRRGNFLSAAETMGIRDKWMRKPRHIQTSSNWLEWRYGWLPLYLDARGAVEALKRVNYPRFTARGFASNRNDTKSRYTASNLGTGGCQPWTMEVVNSAVVNVRAYQLYTVDDGFIMPSAFGLTDPVSTAWELIPFSFVVDWFVDVGTWLSAMKPTPGVVLLANGYTVQRIGSSTETVVGVTNLLGDYSHVGLLGITRGRLRNQKDRAVNFSVPLLPSFGKGLNLVRTLDAVSLLTQLFDKRK